MAYRIVATYDESHMALDTLNTLTLDDVNFDYRYILAILNSQLMNFYFRYMISNKAALNIHLDSPYLGEIPIRKNQRYENKIIKLVNVELESNGENKEILNEINNNIYEIYDISPEERQKINLMK